MSDTDRLHKERSGEYGEWSSQAEVAQSIKESFKFGANYDECTPQVKEKLDMIANKLSRIVNGNQFNIDSWDDIAGYATLPNDDESSISSPLTSEDEYDELIDTKALWPKPF